MRGLLARQFPNWADLPITPVAKQGNDHRTFRLGDDRAVRLPSHASYVAGITKEDTVLPLLAGHLSLPIPAVVATGHPTEAYPYPWSVRRWMPGDTPDRDPQLDRSRLAHDLGAFLRELRSVPDQKGPAAGRHSFYRGCHPSVYGDQVQQSLTELDDTVDVQACEWIWHDALRSAWNAEPVWFHGDFATGNLLTTEGRLSAVIDFGTCGVGDPACDLVIAWTLLESDERQTLREAVALPDDTWARARGWALWKALLTLTDPLSSQYQTQMRALTELLNDLDIA